MLKWSIPIAAALIAVIALVRLWNVAPVSHRFPLSPIEPAVMWEPFSRGGARTAVSYAGFRLFVVSPRRDRVRADTGLRLDDTITFTYSYAKKQNGYFMLLGLQENTDAPLWYYPDIGETSSVQIEGDTVDKPLGDGILLSLNHKSGPLRIVSLFSATPFRVDEVEEALAQLIDLGERMNPEASIAAKMKNTDIVEYSVLINIEE